MLEPLKNWPNQAVLARMVREGKNPDEVFLYAITSQIGLDDERGGIMPSTVLVGVVGLDDSTHGVITPRRFNNWAIPQEEVAKLSKVIG